MASIENPYPHRTQSVDRKVQPQTWNDIIGVHIGLGWLTMTDGWTMAIWRCLPPFPDLEVGRMHEMQRREEAL